MRTEHFNKLAPLVEAKILALLLGIDWKKFQRFLAAQQPDTKVGILLRGIFDLLPAVKGARVLTEQPGWRSIVELVPDDADWGLLTEKLSRALSTSTGQAHLTRAAREVTRSNTASLEAWLIVAHQESVLAELLECLKKDHVRATVSTRLTGYLRIVSGIEMLDNGRLGEALQQTPESVAAWYVDSFLGGYKADLTTQVEQARRAVLTIRRAGPLAKVPDVNDLLALVEHLIAKLPPQPFSVVRKFPLTG